MQVRYVNQRFVEIYFFSSVISIFVTNLILEHTKILIRRVDIKITTRFSKSFELWIKFVLIFLKASNYLIHFESNTSVISYMYFTYNFTFRVTIFSFLWLWKFPNLYVTYNYIHIIELITFLLYNPNKINKNMNNTYLICDTHL